MKAGFAVVVSMLHEKAAGAKTAKTTKKFLEVFEVFAVQLCNRCSKTFMRLGELQNPHRCAIRRGRLGS
jgi:hypothetical protein